MNHAIPLSAAAALLLLAGCDDTSSAGAETTGAGTTTSSGGAQRERGPAILDMDGDPNGLFWDDESQTLFIAEDNGNRILQWTDDAGFALYADLPAAPADGAGLGQLVLIPDGTLVVTRFGGGTAGDVVFVSVSGDTGVVPSLDPIRRRIGLTLGPSGTLYDSWFVRMSSGARVGSVGSLTLEGSEPEVITGLQKPVGVVALGDSIFVSDQDLGQILKAPLSAPQRYAVFATVDGPDLLSAGPDASLFTGSTGGNLFRISASGDASVFESGFQQVRGSAYDPTNRRIFVADHDADESDGITHSIHILPVD
jgi:hypothetical protein